MGPPPLPPPMKVSPTIKFFRWGLLIAGFFYGKARHARLAKTEVVVKEIERQERMLRDAKIAEEKRIASERDIEMLTALAGELPEAPKVLDDAEIPSSEYFAEQGHHHIEESHHSEVLAESEHSNHVGPELSNHVEPEHANHVEEPENQHLAEEDHQDFAETEHDLAELELPNLEEPEFFDFEPDLPDADNGDD